MSISNLIFNLIIPLNDKCKRIGNFLSDCFEEGILYSGSAVEHKTVPDIYNADKCMFQCIQETRRK